MNAGAMENVLERVRPFTLFLALMLSGQVCGSAAAALVEPLVGPIIGRSWPAAAASNGTSALIVWRVGSAAIWGVGVDESGAQTGPAHRLIQRVHPITQYSLHAGPDSGFWLAWYDSVEGMHLTRISAGGELETWRLDIPNSRFILVTRDRILIASLPYEPAELRLMDAEGALIFRFPLPTNAEFSIQAVTLADGSFAVLTLGWDGLDLHVIDGTGSLLRTHRIEGASGTTGTAYRPTSAALATDGSKLFLTWIAGAYNTPADIKRAIVSPDGSAAAGVLVTGAFPSAGWIQLALHGQTLTGTLLASDNSSSGLFSELYALHFSTVGDLLGPPYKLHDGHISAVRARLDFPARHMVVMEQGSYGAEIISTIAIPLEPPQQGAPSPTATVVSLGAAQQHSPEAASDGNGWLLSWIETTATDVTLRAMKLGRAAGPAGDPINLTTVPVYLSAPRVADDGTGFLVTALWGQTVQAIHVDRAGTISSAPFMIGPSRSGRYDLDGRDGRVFVTRETDGQIHVVRVMSSTTENVVVQQAPASDDPAYGFHEQNAHVAIGRDDLVLVWERVRTELCDIYFQGPPCPSTRAVMARRFSLDGQPEGEAVLLRTDASVADLVATDDRFVAFLDGRDAVVLDTNLGVIKTSTLFDVSLGLVRAFRAGSEAIVTLETTPGVQGARRISSAGVIGPLLTWKTGQGARPASMNLQGEVLTVSSRAVQDPPHYGSGAVGAETTTEFSIPRVRAIRR